MTNELAYVINAHTVGMHAHARRLMTKQERRANGVSIASLMFAASRGARSLSDA